MKNLLMGLMICMFGLGLVACDDGPAEEFGEKIDNAVEDAGNAVEDACEEATDENC